MSVRTCIFIFCMYLYTCVWWDRSNRIHMCVCTCRDILFSFEYQWLCLEKMQFILGYRHYALILYCIHLFNIRTYMYIQEALECISKNTFFMAMENTSVKQKIMTAVAQAAGSSSSSSSSISGNRNNNNKTNDDGGNSGTDGEISSTVSGPPSILARLLQLPITGTSHLVSMLMSTTPSALSLAEAQRIYPATLQDAPTEFCKVYFTLPRIMGSLFPSLKLKTTGRLRLAKTNTAPVAAKGSCSNSIDFSSDNGVSEAEVEVSLLGATFMASICGYLLFEVLVSPILHMNK
jgi:hypothetical protein